MGKKQVTRLSQNLKKRWKTSKSSKTPISRRGDRKQTRQRRGLESVGNPWKTKVFASPARPARERTWAKKMAYTVIANPRKTLEKQVNPAKRQRTDVGKKNRLHGYRTSANRWKPLGNMVSLMVPMFCGASADLTGSRGCLLWNAIKSAESPKTLSCSQSLAMLYACIYYIVYTLRSF